MIGQILSSVTGLATPWLDSKAQQKLHETEIKKKQLTGEIDWELEAICSAQNSWKDELWTIVFVCILAANFVPSLQDAMARGFANLETTPSGFSGECMRRLPPVLEQEPCGDLKNSVYTRYPA